MSPVLPELGRRILILLETEPNGMTRSMVQGEFPTNSVDQALKALERRGLVEIRHQAHGVSSWRIYVRTSRPVGDQVKLTVFVDPAPPAEA